MCCCTTCEKLKLKFATSWAPSQCLVDRLWCPSGSQSLASHTSSLLIWGWRSMAAITATWSYHSSCLWCATCQPISLSYNKTAHLHTGHATLRFLEQSTPTFVPADLWPPNGTDLNPVDYKMWGDIQQWMHQLQLYSIDIMKKCVLDVWHIMDGPEHHWQCSWRLS